MAIVKIEGKDLNYYIIANKRIVIEYNGTCYHLELSRSYWKKRLLNLKSLILIDINSVDTMQKLKGWLVKTDQFGDIIEYCFYLRFYNKNYMKCDEELLNG